MVVQNLSIEEIIMKKGSDIKHIIKKVNIYAIKAISSKNTDYAHW